MKTITMNYSEYENMVQNIKQLSQVVEEFKKESNVVLIDSRGNSNIPRIIINDKTMAKEYLQKEFESLSREFHEFKQNYSPMMLKHSKPKKSFLFGF